MAGKGKLSQLEAAALLHAIHFLQAGDWLAAFDWRERKAIDAAREKLTAAFERAVRLSIPKGLTERPATAKTIWDVEPPLPSALRPKDWPENYKPWEETKAGHKATYQRQLWVERRRKDREALRKRVMSQRLRLPKDTPKPDQ